MVNRGDGRGLERVWDTRGGVQQTVGMKGCVSAENTSFCARTVEAGWAHQHTIGTRRKAFG